MEIPLEEGTLSQEAEEANLAVVVVIHLVEGETHSQVEEMDISAEEAEEICLEEEEIPLEEETLFPEADTSLMACHSLRVLPQAEEAMDRQKQEEVLDRVTTEKNGIFGNIYPTELMYLPSRLN